MENVGVDESAVNGLVPSVPIARKPWKSSEEAEGSSIRSFSIADSRLENDF